MNIDFVELPLPSRRAWILALLPAALALFLWCALVELHTRLDKQRKLKAAAELAVIAPTAPLAMSRHLPSYQAEAFAAVTRAAFPEADALTEIEHVEVTGIKLRSIDVNPAQDTVLVELDAANDAALGDYLDQLNAGDEPQKWHIQKLTVPTNEARSNAASTSSSVQVRDVHSVSIARRR